MKTRCSILRILSIAVCFWTGNVFAQKDTLRVMAYNVLYYGNGCQGPNSNYHNYLKTIVAYTNPDILSLEKMGAIATTQGDKYATAPYGFADSIVDNALNEAYPGRYAYCPFSNEAHTNNVAVLFYDQRKLGFAGVVSSYVNITDFNTYKLYYKDPNLARTHDTTFLYVLPTHDRSGDDNEQVRGAQIAGELKVMKAHFKSLPNFINLGDFNVRNSNEPFYRMLTTGDDTGFRFYDPPFYPDHRVSYPANWDHNPEFAEYLTTSTRQDATVPNTCGTGGGAKNWYDHIFLSSWLVNNTDHIKYIPGSYHTVGNDGQRYKVSINNANAHINSAAPAEVIEALYQMSNKYPVILDLEVTANLNGVGPADPEIKGVKDEVKEAVSIKLDDGMLALHFPVDMIGQEIDIACMDKDGKTVLQKTKTIKDADMQVKCKLAAGKYTVNITGHHNLVASASVNQK